MNTISYTLTFETQSGTAELKNLSWQLPQYFLTHEPNFAGGAFRPLYQMSFWHHGDAIRDFSGQALDIADLFSSPPDPIVEASWNIADPFLQIPRGHVTFGSGNSILDWYTPPTIVPDPASPDTHWSQPRDALDSPLVNLEDSSIFVGKFIYGDAFSNGDDHLYYFNPGRWQVSAQRLGAAAENEGSPDLLSQSGPAPEWQGSERRRS